MDYNNSEFLKQFIDTVKAVSPARILFVCSREYDRYGYRKALDTLGIDTIAFTDFEPCPEAESAHIGADVFKSNGCDFIIAVGGGSAIDVAKAIKLFAESDTKILAVPTTAGTGAEVTRFSVLYNHGDKCSVRSWDIIPDYQIFDYTTLESLPYNQRVVTGLDAFAHSLEAYWSKDATEESRRYSAEALDLFYNNYSGYLCGDKNTYSAMMRCSELAGRAINIAQTTAAHAFSYKLHKLKGFEHGKAVAICLAYIWKYMLVNGDDAIKSLMLDAQKVSHYTPDSFEELLSKLELLNDLHMTQGEFEETINGVDVGRLSNHPMEFAKSDIEKIYKSFIKVV